MGVKFAGARNIDDRRRRRLVSEHEQQPGSTLSEASSAGYLKIHRFQPNSPEPPRSPIVSLIPDSRWRIWLYCLGIPALVLGGMLLELFVGIAPESPLFGILDFETGQVWRFLRGLTLLGCAGLCWLISWFRSASVRDFEGCYKSWYWSGWILLILAIFSGTDGYLVFGEVIQQYTRISGENFGRLIWLVPMVSLMIEPFRCFTREMWHCRRSWLVLWGCCLSGVVFAWAGLHGPHTRGYVPQETLAITAAIASVTTPTLLFAALLSQVHYVMYVSSDPVPKRISWIVTGIARAAHSLVWGLWSVLGMLMLGVSRGCGGLRTACKTAAESRRAKRQAKATTPKKTRRRKPTVSQEEETGEQTTPEETEANGESGSPRAKSSSRSTPSKSRTKRTAKTTTSKKAAPATPKTAEETETVPVSAAEQQEESTVSADKTTTNSRTEKPRIRLKSSTRSASVVPADTTSAPTAPTSNSQASANTAKPVVQANHQEPAKNNQDSDEDWNDADDSNQDGLDPNMLRGLSKKERRKLRKQFRDQQRAKAG